MKSIAYALLLLLTAPFAVAQSIPGEDSPYYEAVMEDWLAGEDDLASLRKLTTLANTGNIAAQLFLGRMEFQPFHLHVTRDLDAKERRALFSSPAKQFRRNWLHDVDHPVAKALWPIEVPDAASAVALSAELAEIGALRDAYLMASVPFNMGDNVALFGALSHPALQPYTLGSVVAQERPVFEIETNNVAISASVALYKELYRDLPLASFEDMILSHRFVHPFIAITNLDTATDQLRMHGGALLYHPKLAALAPIVRDICQDDPAHAMGVIFRISPGTPLQLAVTSPMAPLINTEEWQSSARFRNDMLRQWGAHSLHADILHDVLPCFADAVTAADGGPLSYPASPD